MKPKDFLNLIVFHVLTYVRMLGSLYDSTKCIEILNRVLLRTDAQINHKIKMELTPSTVSNDTKDCPKPPPSVPIPIPSGKSKQK